MIKTSLKPIQIGNMVKRKTFANPTEGRVYDKRGISPCVIARGEGRIHIIENVKYE